jgi:hypothetical protein
MESGHLGPNQSMSELYKQTYLTLMNNEHHHVTNQQYQYKSTSNTHPTIPPPYIGNMKPINSPLCRSPSTTDEEPSELDDCEKDPNKKNRL